MVLGTPAGLHAGIVYKKIRRMHTLIAGVRLVAKVVRLWFNVYRATPDMPWHRRCDRINKPNKSSAGSGLQKPYLVFDDARLVVLNPGGALSPTVHTMLLPLLPRYKNVANERPNYLSEDKWAGNIRINRHECPPFTYRADRLPDWQRQDELTSAQSDYHCFACVGNPFERLVHHLRQGYVLPPFLMVITPRARGDMAAHKALHRMVDLVSSFPDHALPSGLGSQYHLLHREGRPLYDCLCRAETFVKDIAPVAKQYGFTPPLKVLAAKNDYRTYYTHSLIDKVALRYRRDIDFFGYGDMVEQLHDYVSGHTKHPTPSGAKKAQGREIAERKHNKSTKSVQCLNSMSPMSTPSPTKVPLRKTAGYCLTNIKLLTHLLLKLLFCSSRRPYVRITGIVSEINPDLIYIANRKCASSSIQTVIKGRIIHNEENGLMHRIKNLLNGVPSLQSNLMRAQCITPKVFYFSFVRNPFLRLTSCYFGIILKFREMDDLEILGRKDYVFPVYLLFDYWERPISFAEFVHRVAGTPDYLADPYIKSQYTTLYENEGIEVDYIGKVENFEHDVRRLFECCGISRDLSDKCDGESNAESGVKSGESVGKTKVNQSLQYDYRDFYTPELVELVAHRYAMDIKTFGYEKALDDLRRYVRQKERPVNATRATCPSNAL